MVTCYLLILQIYLYLLGLLIVDFTSCKSRLKLKIMYVVNYICDIKDPFLILQVSIEVT